MIVGNYYQANIPMSIIFMIIVMINDYLLEGTIW